MIKYNMGSLLIIDDEIETMNPLCDLLSGWEYEVTGFTSGKQALEALKEKEINTKQHPKIDHDLFTVFGKNNEAEIWLKPCDAFEWDDQMVDKIRLFFGNVYVLAVEDYILTKLARSDRTSIDIDDILKIIIANKDSLNWEYLHFRLKWVDLESDFQEIIKAFELDFNNNVRNISKEILDKIK